MSSQKFEVLSIRKNKQSTIIKRKAELTDLDSLVKISKVCFPDQILWDLKFFSKKYWTTAFKSNSDEIWIWQIDGEIAAVSLLVTDLIAWNNQKVKSRQFSIIIRIGALIINPKLLFLKIKKRIWNAYYLYNERKKNGALIAKNKINNLKSMSETIDNRSYYYGGIYSNPESHLWIELAAVIPKYRHYGLAIQIIRFNEERALFIGRKEIYGVIEAIIKPWWMLHERLGYQRIHEESGRYTYRKILKEEQS